METSGDQLDIKTSLFQCISATDCPVCVIFFRGTHIVRNNFGSIFNYIYFRGLGLRVMVWVMVRARVWVGVVLWSW